MMLWQRCLSECSNFTCFIAFFCVCDFYDIFLLFNTVTPKPVMGPQEGVKFQQINIWKKMFKNLPRGTIWTI